MEFNNILLDNGILYLENIIEKEDLNNIEKEILNEKIHNMLIMGSGIYSNYSLDENEKFNIFIRKVLTRLKDKLSLEAIYFFNDAN